MDKIKQTITVICLLLMAALFCVQTVSAGSMNAGDSFDTATEIEPGFYEDELTFAEEKYSYIVLTPGQELILKTTTDECSYASQLWKPKKQPQPSDYSINPKIPKIESTPQPLSADPSKHAQFRTYSTLYG